jgi:C-terminal processing protease CtpA/Prc
VEKQKQMRELNFVKKSGEVFGARLFYAPRNLLYVSYVVPNGLAWKLGLSEGDRIDYVNDRNTCDPSARCAF